MEWDKQQVCLLIDMFRENRVLWDPSDPDYKNRNRKHEAWASIAATLDTSRDVVESKMRKLIGQFQREVKKGKSGAGVEEASRKWFAYRLLLFLKDRTQPTRLREAGFVEHQNLQEEDSQKHLNHSAQDLQENIQKIESTSPTASNFRDMPVEATLGRPFNKRHNDECDSEPKEIEQHFKKPKSKDDRCDVFAEYIAFRMRDIVDYSQRLIAERLISDSLFMAEMGQLTISHSICAPSSTGFTNSLDSYRKTSIFTVDKTVSDSSAT